MDPKMNALSRGRLFVYLIGSFLGGIVVTVAAPWVASRAADHFIHTEHKEIARVASPDGKVEAVMIRDNCGAPCSYGYSVYIVPRGVKPSADSQGGIFYAEDMEEAQLTWKQPHLLSVGYRKALIYKLRNLSYPFGESGANEGDWTYKVEIQLEPSSSTGFSYLQAKDLQ
jgi:hypothetical protein